MSNVMVYMAGEQTHKVYCKKHRLAIGVFKDGLIYCGTCYAEAYAKFKRGMLLEAKASQGNKTIGDDTLIFNMTCATECASKRLGLCKIPKECYAMKAEKAYPTVLPYRRRQTRIWDATSGYELGLQLVRMAQESSIEVKCVRFSEAGDFRDQADVDKMSEVARALEHWSIRLYGYTARSDLDFSKCHPNMVVNGSGFMVHNAFTAVKVEELEKGDWVCKTDCRICDKCKDRNGLFIRDRIK